MLKVLVEILKMVLWVELKPVIVIMVMVRLSVTCVLVWKFGVMLISEVIWLMLG